MPWRLLTLFFTALNSISVGMVPGLSRELVSSSAMPWGLLTLFFTALKLISVGMIPDLSRDLVSSSAMPWRLLTLFSTALTSSQSRDVPGSVIQFRFLLRKSRAGCPHAV